MIPNINNVSNVKNIKDTNDIPIASKIKIVLSDGIEIFLNEYVGILLIKANATTNVRYGTIILTSKNWFNSDNS